ncbi:Cilia- and flagella-associated protein 91, partial [Irineochytrium annulatum]
VEEVGYSDEEEDVVGEETDETPTEPVDMTSPEWLDKMFESNVQAEYVGRTLDYLSKELVRLREERRISALVKLAERTRRMREADETDRRQNEVVRRKQEDDVFRHVMRVHQETVDSYLEDIVAGAVNQTASIQARKQVRDYAEKINGFVEEMEKKRYKALTVCDWQ